ncbi:MAG: Asp-tRNA(Asn)/Glu-tRNA(Gln) amidotransferase subunit GatA [Bdellovibrionales bacterium]|nr:Asp-tRNA(Asn)/Glu-tRNA(Gln) amidotransferase subunit GatA [Bdellovibrionales bacterium]
MSSTPAALLNGSYESLRRALDEFQISSVALTGAALDRAEATNPNLNAYISFCRESALREAANADLRLRAGERAPLLGIPVGVKDLILTQGHTTTAASKMLANFVPPYESTVTARLRAAGAPIIGKTNLDEFAMGSSNETSAFGAVKNPWDLSRVPGGSSGGSAAAVAARSVTLSLGTDTGGSIRQPSAFTGITGIKPTYGRVSRYGVVAFASSLDQVGPMCADASSCAATLQVIAGHDVHDATCSRRAVPNFLQEAQDFVRNESVRSLRIGVPREYFMDGLNPEVEKIIRRGLDVFREHGATLVDVSLPHTRFALPVYYLICTSEASSNLARYDGIHCGHRAETAAGGTLADLYAQSRGEAFGDEVKMRILLGTYALSAGYFDAFYRKASQVRTLLRRDFEEAFRVCDVIAGPTSPTTAFRLGEKTGDPLSMYLADVYTLATNLAGLPGISFNAGFDAQSLPVGFHMMSPWWEESRLLGAAAAYQQWHPETLRVSPVAAGLGGAA